MPRWRRIAVKLRKVTQQLDAGFNCTRVALPYSWLQVEKHLFAARCVDLAKFRGGERGLAAQCPQCRTPALATAFALADTASTDSVKVRCSFAFIAPTPMSL